MTTGCELCGRTPAEGGSTIETKDGVKHPFCHPVTGDGPRPLSCFEIIGYTMVERHPLGRRPPQPIPAIRQARARVWVADHE